MRQIWLLAMALVMLPNTSFAQEPSDGPTLAPHILKPLKDEDWDVRAEAARTLHLTRGATAVPYLIDAISPRDWKLTFEAMKSLKKLQAPEADKVLGNIARTYWHPAIASAAGDLLKGNTPPRKGILDGDVIRSYCEARADQSLLPRCSPNRDDAQDISRFNQERQDYTQRFVESFTNNPVLKDAQLLGPSLKTSDGEFDSIDNGEFGGELFFTNGITRQTILKENIIALAKQNNRIIVVAGLDHMLANRGYILELTRGPDRLWTAKRLWRLPGTPHHVLLAPNGTIGLHGSFGSVLYKPDDTLEWLACGESYQCRK